MTAAVIFGCAGTELTPNERDFFRETRPLGFILFARNIVGPDQLVRLTGQLRDSIDDPAAPILIDQEGGRVQRLRPPHWRAAPPAERFGQLASGDLAAGCRAVKLNHRLIAAELTALGIDVDCAPLIDIRVPGAHDVIGDRAYGGEPELVAILGRAAAEGLLEGGVMPIIKHIPGHGRSMVDSHHDLPRVAAGRAELSATDFRPFHALNDIPWAMTAHIVYEAIDADSPATLSTKVIADVIRGEIGFDGLLLTDDLSMKALNGKLGDLAQRSLTAGCDVVLHCNGDMAEMRQVAAGAAPLSPAAKARYERGQDKRERARLASASTSDMAALRDELTRLIA
ncbi:beta-N-acetylhexosaminidase [Dongia soli]|uniref:beta-N-acetylhexosaminidase n=1 Tax=Dongia soli TaxID=600628 RepID=A0ABU5EGF9_9PROT|nr:beta-N-acetylhexosaminidase [Dongia soli]MDY0885094.1 beta-N-acetylhexosaminidase [Dongia soli]